MRDAFEALAAEDPAAAAYHHGDLAGLTARIVSTRTRTARAPRAFRTAIAAVVAATGAMTAALVALLAAGPTLPVLAFAAPRPATLYAAAKTATPSVGTVMRRRPLAMPVTGALGPAPSLAAAYRVTLPGTSLRVVERLAGSLGVVGSIGAYNGTVFSETSRAGARVVYDTSSGLATWRYQSGTTPGLTVAELEQAIADEHWAYRVAVASRGGAAAVVVDGSVTALRVTTTVRRGHVVDASGPAFRVAASVNYPLRSPTGALAGLTSVAPTRATSYSLSWSAYTLSDSTIWLLPTFVFRGRTGGHPWTASALAVKTASVTGTGS